MNNRRWLIGILVLLLLAAGAVMLGSYAYSTGVAQGLAQSGALAAPGGGGAPVPAPYYYGAPYGQFGLWGFGPWGWAFGLVRCLVPLLAILLFISLVRGVFWRRPWGYGHRFGPGGPFDEWHRRAHAASGEAGAESAPPAGQP